jgi:hypothetical protein
MLKIFNQLKYLNRQRLASRRKIKFETILSNEFDKSNLQLDSLRPLLAKTPKYEAARESTKKFAIYSTFFGASNVKTFNNTAIDLGFDHYFISNNQDILKIAQGKGWRPIFVELPLTNNRVLSAQQSKIPKALPHYFPALNNYEFLLYVDDKIEFNANKVNKLLLVHTLPGPNFSIMIREHPSLKGNILNELAVSMIQPRYQSQRDQLVEYITCQIKQGHDLKVEHLYWTSAIIRNMTHPDTKIFGEQWYQDILNCGIECQVSFDFVAQRYKSIRLMPQVIT